MIEFSDKNSVPELIIGPSGIEMALAYDGEISPPKLIIGPSGIEI